MNKQCNATYPYRSDFPVLCELEDGHEGKHFFHHIGGTFTWDDILPTLGIAVSEKIETKDKPG